MDDEFRRSAENLIILCYRHHRELDVSVEHSVADIVAMKQQHEAQFAEKPFTVPEQTVDEIVQEQQSFWVDVARINAEARASFELIRPIDADANFEALAEDLANSIESLVAIADNLSGYVTELDQKISPFLREQGFKCPDDDWWETLFDRGYGLHHRIWEDVALGLPNHSSHAATNLLQLRLRFAELEQQAGDDSAETKEKIQALREELTKIAKYSAYVD